MFPLKCRETVPLENRKTVLMCFMTVITSSQTAHNNRHVRAHVWASKMANAFQV